MPQSPPYLLGPDDRIDLRASPSGQLVSLDDQPFFLKGVNWAGMETSERQPLGLRVRPAGAFLDFTVEQRFNAVRLHFNMEDWALNQVVPDVSAGPNAALRDVSYSMALRWLVRAAAERRLAVVLACSRVRRSYSDKSVSKAEWPGTWDGLWYDEEFPEPRMRSLWAHVAKIFCEEWNVAGVDLLSEPHGANWGSGKPALDWDIGAAKLGNAVLDSCPRLLVFVQGISDPGQWGENLMGAHRHPVLLRDPLKLVYSPHTFGPSAFVAPAVAPASLRSPEFPANLPAEWGRLFGFLPGLANRATPVVVGEAGGSCSGRDEVWHRTLVDYLRETGCGLFYAGLMPSANIGGLLLSDFETPSHGKLKILDAMPVTMLARANAVSTHSDDGAVNVAAGLKATPLPGPHQAAPLASCATGTWKLRVDGAAAPAGPRVSSAGDTWKYLEFLGTREDSVVPARGATVTGECMAGVAVWELWLLRRLPVLERSGEHESERGFRLPWLACGGDYLQVVDSVFIPNEAETCQRDELPFVPLPTAVITGQRLAREARAEEDRAFCTNLDPRHDLREQTCGTVEGGGNREDCLSKYIRVQNAADQYRRCQFSKLHAPADTAAVCIADSLLADCGSHASWRIIPRSASPSPSPGPPPPRPPPPLPPSVSTLSGRGPVKLIVVAMLGLMLATIAIGCMEVFARGCRRSTHSRVAMDDEDMDEDVDEAENGRGDGGDSPSFFGTSEEGTCPQDRQRHAPCGAHAHPEPSLQFHVQTRAAAARQLSIAMARGPWAPAPAHAHETTGGVHGSGGTRFSI